MTVRQRDGIPDGWVKEVELGVGGSEQQAVAMCEVNQRVELTREDLGIQERRHLILGRSAML